MQHTNVKCNALNNGPGQRADPRLLPSAVGNRVQPALLTVMPTVMLQGPVAVLALPWGGMHLRFGPLQMPSAGACPPVLTQGGGGQVEVDKTKIEQSGTVGWIAWRSVYLAKQVECIQCVSAMSSIVLIC
jgi:hypothetical protein